jgi:hypothetical protein
MTIDEIKALIEWSKNLGAKKIKINDLYVEFNDTETDFKFVSAAEKEAVMQTDKEPTEDELLFYSTSHYDELREERKSKEQKAL